MRVRLLDIKLRMKLKEKDHSRNHKSEKHVNESGNGCLVVSILRAVRYAIAGSKSREASEVSKDGWDVDNTWLASVWFLEESLGI